MARELEFGAGIWMFQQFVDRYASDSYGPPVSTLEAIERAAEVGDVRSLDINDPFAGEDVSVSDVREALERTGIRAEAITPHLIYARVPARQLHEPRPGCPAAHHRPR
jgi:xylose isomerase